MDARAKKISEGLRKKNVEIEAVCQQHDCTFLESWIQQKRTRIKFICKCGREWEAYWCNFRRYPNCKKCGAEKISGPNCYMYDPDREAVAARKRFRKACGQFIARAMKKTGQTKRDHTYTILGYTAKELQDHIQNHPNYKNCTDGFHIDHIFPVQAFLDHGINDLTVINKLCNLQPLPGSENISKADTYDEKSFVEWYQQICDTKDE